MNKVPVAVLAALCILGFPGCVNPASPGNGNKQENPVYPANFYKSFTRADQYSDGLPAVYRWTDYRAIAEQFHNLAFDASASGGFLPLSQVSGSRITMKTYVGGNGGEGIALIPALVSAGLNGFDIAGKQSSTLSSTLSAANAYFSAGEGVILNNIGGSSAGASFWYLLFPALHYTRLSLLNPDETQMRQNCLTAISRWYTAYENMKTAHFSNTDLSTFTPRSYNFANNTVVTKPAGGNWSEPDCAAGMAVLFYTGYQLTGEQKYLDAARYLLDWLNSAQGGPLYEVLHYYTPALMAVFNALHRGSYDITKALNENFDGVSAARSGWGAMAGTWGSLPVNGLFGSVTDRGGYAFSMNTFAAAGAIAPLARYDARYARSIGKWLLHLHSNARYFFAAETNRSYQSYYNSAVNGQVDPRIVAAVPYEGVIKEFNGIYNGNSVNKIPWVGGDPTIQASPWAATDFSLYSGNQTGILGALYSQTAVEGILKINLSVTGAVPVDEWPGFLLYNPHDSGKQVSYSISSNGTVNLFDTVLNKILAQNVSGTAMIVLPARTATVVVEVPANLEIGKQGQSYFAGGRYVSTEF